METLKTSDLHFLENNVRSHPEEQIKALEESIKEFGFINPIVVDENNKVLVGNGRVEAAINVGIETVPAIRVTDLTEDQKRAYIIIENKLIEAGGWNYELLNSEIEAIGLDMTRFGFDKFSGMEVVEGDEIQKTFKNTNQELDFELFDDDNFEFTCENCGFRFNG